MMGTFVVDSGRFRVLVVSANQRLRGVLPMLLSRQATLHYEGSANSPHEALTLFGRISADVVVSDLPPANAQEVLTWRSICEHGPRLVMLTRYLEQRMSMLSVLARASGLVLVPEGNLAEAISGVASGERLRSRELTARLGAIASGELPSPLTAPERRLFELVSEGHGDHTLASTLGTTPDDVREQIALIAEKLS